MFRFCICAHHAPSSRSANPQASRGGGRCSASWKCLGGGSTSSTLGSTSSSSPLLHSPLLAFEQVSLPSPTWPSNEGHPTMEFFRPTIHLCRLPPPSSSCVQSAMQSAMQKLVCLAVLKKCANASLCRCSVEMKVNLYEFSRSAKMQERPFCENEVCKRLFWRRGLGCRMPWHLREIAISRKVAKWR